MCDCFSDHRLKLETTDLIKEGIMTPSPWLKVNLSSTPETTDLIKEGIMTSVESSFTFQDFKKKQQT